MSLATFTKNVDRDYYKAAALWKSPDGDTVSPLQFFTEDLKQQHGVYPEQHELKQHEDYWIGELGIQPYQHRRIQQVKRFAQQSWALETAFREAGITVRGEDASTIQKAFTTSSTQVLFPFFFDTNIVAGILASDVLSQLVAEVIPINSHTADHLTLSDTAGDRNMGLTGEGATFIQLTVRSDARRVTLRKFGAVLKTTYEAMRLARLPLLARFLQRVGQQYANDITDLAIETLIAGDGAGDGAATTVATASAGLPVYSDLLSLEFDFTQGYRPTTLVATKESIQDLLKFPAFIDPLAGVLHQTRGSYPSPIGMNLVRWDYTGKATSYATTKVIMLDSSIAMVQYTEGGLIQESDRVIDGQWAEDTISTWTGFGIMDRQAVRTGTGW